MFDENFLKGSHKIRMKETICDFLYMARSSFSR
jgi:hypothetical protein